MATGLTTGMPFARYHQQSQWHGHSRLLTSYMTDVLFSCKDLFQRNLFGHYGCVNAIEFSNKGGAYLVSGGDDRRVLMWNVNEVCAGVGKPWCMRGEHISNIFCTVFDNSNTHIFSGGNDEQVFRHDVQTKETVGMYFHDEAVYGISVHPESDEVFVTACDDGRVLIWDTRSTEPSVLSTQPTAFHAAVFNPVEPYLIATANSSHGVSLWDSRVPCRALMNYGARNYNCAMGVKFNSLGTHLTVLGRRLPPVLYRLERSTPVMEFHHPGYINSCTMKSSCFAGNNDQYIVSGSDDFNVYIWKVPEVCEPRSKPVIVNRAHLVLQGHRSIVNQVRFNSHTHTLCTAGVEKVIKIWSPYRMPGCTGDINKSPQHTKRDFFSHQDYIEFILESGRPLGHEYDEQSQEEDPRMLAFFDSLIQREQSGSSSDSDDSLLSTGESYLRFVNDDSSDSSDNERRGMSADRLRELILRPRGETPDTHNHRVTLRRLRKLATAFMLREISDTSSDSSAAESGHEDQSLEARLRSLSESAKPSTSSFDPLEVRGSTPELSQNGSCVHGIRAKFRNFRRVKRRYRAQTMSSMQQSSSCSSSDEEEEEGKEKASGCSMADTSCAASAENTVKVDEENATASHNLEQLGQTPEKKVKKSSKKKKKRKIKGKRAKGNCSGETSKSNHHNNGANNEDKTKSLLNAVDQSTTESSTSSSESEEERRKLTIISKRHRNTHNTGDMSSNSSSSEDSLLSGQNALDSSSSSTSSDDMQDLPNTLEEGPWVKQNNNTKHCRGKRAHRDSQPLLRKYSRSPRRRPNGSSVEDERQ